MKRSTQSPKKKSVIIAEILLAVICLGAIVDAAYFAIINSELKTFALTAAMVFIGMFFAALGSFALAILLSLKNPQPYSEAPTGIAIILSFTTGTWPVVDAWVNHWEITVIEGALTVAYLAVLVGFVVLGIVYGKSAAAQSTPNQPASTH